MFFPNGESIEQNEIFKLVIEIFEKMSFVKILKKYRKCFKCFKDSFDI
jgi:hypothetical protein